MNLQFLTALKEWRMKQAMLEDIPLYYVFSNITLEELAACEDLNREILANISGVGERKIAKYGSAILDIWNTVQIPLNLNTK